MVGYGVSLALGSFLAVSFLLGWLAQRAIEKGSFARGYFQGNRGLGVWAVALTATVQSGGTFMGFPSLVYTHGWIMTVWIAGYMVVPITSFGILGKRFAQISRRTGALTVPDLLSARFNSPTLGLAASGMILFFMTAMMVAQFKAGALLVKLVWPWTDVAATEQTNLDTGYYLGLALFSVTVVAYTAMGGFLAAVWTDVFQSLLMLVGVLLLLPLAVSAAGGMEQATLSAVKLAGPEFAFGPGAPAGSEYLPLGLAASFFVVWVFACLGTPASMVRVMACRDTASLRRSVFVLAIYNAMIYLPLVVICVAARSLLPGLKVSDEVIPRLALWTTRDLPGSSLWAGLILAAPFGAVMATVSCYLVVIASGLVRDIYQGWINPKATPNQMRYLSYAAMVLVGLIGAAANLRPPEFLQAVVVFAGAGAASAFVVVAFMAAYWPRATATGAIAAMLTGAGTHLGLFLLIPGLALLGIDAGDGRAPSFRPYYLLGLEPIVWSLPLSLLVGVVVSLLGPPPEEKLVSRFFD